MGMFFIGIVTVIIAAVAFVIYRRLEQEKAETARLLSLNNSVKQIQERYKTVVAEIASQNLIDSESRRKLTSVVNNYFIFQPVNTINLAHLTDLADVFIHAIEGHFAEPKISDERLSELLEILGTAIPDNTRDFSANYYLNYAPGLFFEFSNHVKDDIHEPEPEADDEDGTDELADDSQPENSETSEDNNEEKTQASSPNQNEN